MSLRTWQETLITAQVDGTALTASTTPTSILPAAAKYTFAANYFSIGKQLLVRAAGRISNIVTTPGTLQLVLKLGSTTIADGGTMALNTTAKTNVPWILEWFLTCRAIGSGTSTTFMHQGRWTSESVIGAPAPASGGVASHMLPNATPAVGTGVDSTATQQLDLFATWSLNNANSIQVHQFGLQSLN